MSRVYAPNESAYTLLIFFDTSQIMDTFATIKN